MSDFLTKWDLALEQARETGKPECLWRWHEPSKQFVAVARTRHPAFMGGPVPKHDPERDQ